MELDLDDIWRNLQKMPAVFVSGLQYDQKSGLIADYFNGVVRAHTLYTLATENEMGSDTAVSQQYRTHFSAHLLGTRTYHDYLEDQLDRFNSWLRRDSAAVQQHLEHWQVKGYLERSFSTDIRPVSDDEFMGTLYHAKAQELNSVVREFKKLITKNVEKDVPFEQMDHRTILEQLRRMADFLSREHRFNNVDELLREYGLASLEEKKQ